jgi:hypothetical protein
MGAVAGPSGRSPELSIDDGRSVPAEVLVPINFALK